MFIALYPVNCIFTFSFERFRRYLLFFLKHNMYYREFIYVVFIFVSFSPHASYSISMVRAVDGAILSPVVTPLLQLWNSSVTYTPSLAGVYFFNITRISGIPAIAEHPGIGYNITVSAGSINQPSCIVSDLLGIKNVGKNYTFTVQLRDSFTNVIAAPGYVLTAQFDFPGPKFYGVFNSSSGLYRFTYASTLVGLKNAVVSYNNVSLQQAFFPVTFVAAAVNAPTSFATLPVPTTTIAGVALTMSVTLRDAFNNPTGDVSSCTDSKVCIFNITISGISSPVPMWTVAYQVCVNFIIL
jgi:hypothetical protein